MTDSSDESAVELDFPPEEESVKKALENMIQSSFEKINFQDQVRNECRALNGRFADLEEDGKVIEAELNKAERTLEEIREEIYRDFRANIKEVPALDLGVDDRIEKEAKRTSNGDIHSISK